MKDKRLDALLETLPEMVCRLYYDEESCCRHKSGRDEFNYYLHTDCQGDIRKCEREE